MPQGQEAGDEASEVFQERALVEDKVGIVCTRGGYFTLGLPCRDLRDNVEGVGGRVDEGHTSQHVEPHAAHGSSIVLEADLQEKKRELERERRWRVAMRVKLLREHLMLMPSPRPLRLIRPTA